MKVLLLFLTLFLFSACSSKNYPPVKHISLKQKRDNLKSEQLKYHLKKRNAITLSLYQSYQKWKNTPYCYGGSSRDGIDCSSLVQIIYKDAFNISLPRTTKDQAKMGYKVAKKEIKEGDLILFKTGYSTHHSGIYLENGNFIHTSTKRGVTLSNLNNPYWKSKYWQTRRILPNY